MCDKCPIASPSCSTARIRPAASGRDGWPGKMRTCVSGNLPCVCKSQSYRELEQIGPDTAIADRRVVPAEAAVHGDPLAAAARAHQRLQQATLHLDLAEPAPSGSRASKSPLTWHTSIGSEPVWGGASYWICACALLIGVRAQLRPNCTRPQLRTSNLLPDIERCGRCRWPGAR